MRANLAAGATAMAMSIATVVALACVPGCNTTEIDRAGSGPMAFAATDDGSSTENGAPGPTVVLRSRPLLLTPRDHVIVDVVARGAADLHGAAFRVTWDPGTLSFVESHSGPTWSKDAITLAKEGTPGQLAVVWTEKGEKSHDAKNETVLGTLTFALVSRKSSALAFMNERAQIVDKSGVPVAVTWRGGTVAAR